MHKSTSVIDPVMILLFMDIIHHTRSRLPYTPPKLLPAEHPQNLESVRVEQEGAMRRRGREVGVEVGEVGEEFGVL